MKNNKKTTKYSNTPKPLPSVKDLNEVITYNPLTGIFTWKVPPIPRFEVGDVVGWTNKEGYIVAILLGKNYSMHRIAYKMYHGVDPDVVHHINHVRSDNRIENIESISAKKHNAFNSIRFQKHHIKAHGAI